MKIYHAITTVLSATAAVDAVANSDTVLDSPVEYMTIAVSTQSPTTPQQPLLAIQTLKARDSGLEPHDQDQTPQPTGFLTVASATSRAKGKRGCFPTSHCDHEHHPPPAPTTTPKPTTTAPRKSHVTRTLDNKWVYSFNDTSVIDEDSVDPSDGPGGAKKRFEFDDEVGNGESDDGYEGDDAEDGNPFAAFDATEEEAAEEAVEAGDDDRDALSTGEDDQETKGEDDIEVTFYTEENDAGSGPEAVTKRDTEEKTEEEGSGENAEGEDDIEVTFYTEENDDGSK